MSNRYDPVDHPGNALATSLLLAAAAHAALILGISFPVPDFDSSSTGLPTLDITMVPDSSAPAPENPDHLANANQDGAGDPEQELAQPEILASNSASAAVSETESVPVLTKKRSREKTDHRQATTRNKIPTGAELIENGLQLAALGDQSHQQASSDADSLKHKHISARTRQHMYANYMAGWVAKVERVGNLNYPDAARRMGLSGTLLLDVALQPDGAIVNITLLRSSGQKVLDDAAVRIVRLAAPFAPFPPEFRRETDILHVTRSWEFLESNQLQGR